jgi:RNA polymerase sigma-70 factor, ECF subfamily
MKWAETRNIEHLWGWMVQSSWGNYMPPTRFAPIQKLLGITDEQLMGRIAGGDDEAAFATLMRRWRGPILGLCLRMIGDLHRAEDLTQETFSRVFAQRKGFQARNRFSTWLWRIALNLCYDDLRASRHREGPWLDSEEVSTEPAPDHHAALVEENQLVRAALDTLSEPYRAVLILRHYEDLKFREIAEVLGVPEGTVKSRMAEALNQLNRRLQGIHAEGAASPSTSPLRASPGNTP